MIISTWRASLGSSRMGAWGSHNSAPPHLHYKYIKFRIHSPGSSASLFCFPSYKKKKKVLKKKIFFVVNACSPKGFNLGPCSWCLYFRGSLDQNGPRLQELPPDVVLCIFVMETGKLGFVLIITYFSIWIWSEIHMCITVLWHRAKPSPSRRQQTLKNWHSPPALKHPWHWWFLMSNDSSCPIIREGSLQSLLQEIWPRSLWAQVY